MRADRIGVGPVAAGESFVDDADGLGRVGVGGGEIAAAEKRDAHGAEIAHVNDGDVGGGIAFGSVRPAGDGEWGIVTAGIHGESVITRDGGLFDAGKRGGALVNVFEEAGAIGDDVVWIVLGVVGNRNPDLDGGEASGVEAGMDLQDAPEAAEEEARAGEKNDGEGDFGDDEEAGEASVAAAESGAASAFAKIFNLGGVG